MKKLILVMMLCIICPKAADVYAAEKVFYDDFDSYSPDTLFSDATTLWTDKAGTLTLNNRGDDDLYLTVENKNSKLARGYSFAKNGVANTAVLYEWDFCQDTYANDQRIEVNASIYSNSSAASTKRTASVRTYNGKLQYTNGTAWADFPVGAEYAEREWYKLKLVVNYAENTYDLYIDDTAVARNIPAYQQSQGAMNTELKFYNNADGTFKIDNVKISTLNKRNVLFSDNFDAFDAGYDFTGQSGVTWTTASAPANNAAMMIKELDGEKCLYLKRINNNATLVRNITSPITTGALIAFEWKLRQETLSDNMRAEILRYGTSTGKAVSVKTEGGKFKLWNKDNTWSDLADYEAGKWYDFKVILNTCTNQASGNGTYNIYINNVNMGTFECPQTSKGLEKYGLQFITYNAAGDFYIDDVAVYNNTVQNSVDNIIDESAFSDVPYSKDDFHIYLCIGQSNMAGRAAIDEYEVEQSKAERVYLFTGLNEWKNAGCGMRYDKLQGYNRYSTVEDRAKFNGLSPAHEFARVLTDAQKGIAVGIVSNAIGGTSIQKWQKDSPYGYYEQAVLRAKNAMEKGTLKGVIWHQGEQNATSYDDYPELLKQLISDLRKDLNIPDLPVVVGKLYNSDEYSEFNTMIEATAEEINNCASVNINGATLNDDGIHYDTSTQRMVGARYGIRMYSLIYGSYCKDFYPYEIQKIFTDNRVNVSASVINATDSDKEVFLITASYEKDNEEKLEKAGVDTKTILKNLGKESFNGNCKTVDEYMNSMYIWETKELYPIYAEEILGE